MEARSAIGDGIKDGTRETERNISMAKIGRPCVHAEWTDSQLNQAKYLIEYNTAREVGKILNTTKNAVLGKLYREKIKNGYTPPTNSKYAVAKTRQRFKIDPSLGEMKCYVCSKTFARSGRFDRFCYECKRTGRLT
tara:strand:- start:597 stop:1004 length:408 start_codon:yes stop_codon:yes gene_type:complete